MITIDKIYGIPLDHKHDISDITNPDPFVLPPDALNIISVVRKTGAYTTTDSDSLIELDGTFVLTLHTPTENRMLTLVNISGSQTLTTVVGLPSLLAGESVDIYHNGTEWRAK